MAVGYSYQIYYRNIRGLYRRGGPGGGWIYRVSVQMMAEAKREAPARSGSLRRAHSISRGRGVNQYAATYHVANSSDHAEYVHFGTRSPITGRGKAMRLAPGNGYGVLYRKMVRGQKANPWLDRACTRVAIRYGGMPVG